MAAMGLLKKAFNKGPSMNQKKDSFGMKPEKPGKLNVTSRGPAATNTIFDDPSRQTLG